MAPADSVLVSADYSQIELRILAHLSEDESFLAAFAQGHDFHATIAAKVYGVAPGDVTADMRSQVKQFSYGIAYGMSAYGVSQRLGIEVGDARDFIDAYYAQFPGVKAFLDSQVERARIDGFTTTMFGRRRYLPELQSSNYRLRAVGESPEAVDSAGVSVPWLRYRAVALAGVLCGVAGAYLSTAHGAGFIREMSAGKGYMALAAMVFGKWRPWPSLLACLLFGFLDAASARLQGVDLPLVGQAPTDLILVLPYVLTVVLLAGFFGRAEAPRALGTPYVKEH